MMNSAYESHISHRPTPPKRRRPPPSAPGQQSPKTPVGPPRPTRRAPVPPTRTKPKPLPPTPAPYSGQRASPAQSRKGQGSEETEL